MRRGSSSGPSELTTNATSMFAASVCARVARPAAFRTSALERGKHGSDQSVAEAHPVADRDIGVLVQEPPGQAGAHELVLGLHVVRGAVRRDDASRHEAGLQLLGERGIPAERTDIEFRQRQTLLRDMRWDGAAAAISRRSSAVAPARSRGPRRQNAQASCVDLLFAGDGNVREG